MLAYRNFWGDWYCPNGRMCRFVADHRQLFEDTIML